MTNFPLRGLAGLLLPALLAAAPAHAGFVAAPMELHFEVGAGASGSLPLTISNKADAPLTVRMSFVDTRWGVDGAEENLEPGTLPRSCAAWVVVAENVLDLGPGEVRRVPVTMTTPDGASGSYWTKMFLEEISTPKGTQAVHGNRTYNIFMKQRVGVRIYEDVPGTAEPELSITNVALVPGEAAPGDPAEAQAPSVRIDVSNLGNSVLRCMGHVEVRDSEGAVAEKIPMGSLGRFVIFPDGKRVLAVKPTQPLGPGVYTALAIVDFGGDHLVAGDMLLEIPSSVVANTGTAGGS